MNGFADTIRGRFIHLPFAAYLDQFFYTFGVVVVFIELCLFTFYKLSCVCLHLNK